jgi:hypothetical protein
MAARKVWRISVSQIALFARVLEFTDCAWIDLPAGESVTLTANEEVVLSDEMKATPSNQMAVILMAPGVLVLPAKDGVSGFTLELPEGATLHFAERTITLAPDGTTTLVKAGTEIIWPGIRRPDSPLGPEHNVVDNHTGEGIFWLPTAGGLVIDQGDARVRFPPMEAVTTGRT